MPSQRIAGVLMIILVNVTIFDVAKLESANAQKDGGCPNHDAQVVIVFDVADPKTPTITRLVHVPPTTQTTGEG